MVGHTLEGDSCSKYGTQIGDKSLKGPNLLSIPWIENIVTSKWEESEKLWRK